jgi:carboxymethylenebutenolidase
MSQPTAEQRYAVIGFCWGGQTTFVHAVNGGVKGFAAGVAFYGPFPYSSGGRPATETSPAVPSSVVSDSIARIKVPMMLLNGGKDTRIAAQMPQLEAAMKQHRKDYSGTNYEGAIHGFMRAQNDPRPTRDPAEEAANLAAAKDAWPKTISFLRKHLGVR